jgi:cobalt-zinc-cadmium efflux system protein
MSKSHHHEHGYEGGHSPNHGGHTHTPPSFGAAFLIGIALNLGYVVGETIYGLLGHSLALLADAGHNLSDILALGMAWGAAAVSRRQPTHRYTYGFRSTSILAALVNAILLLVVTGGIMWEAIRRLAEPEPSAGLTIIVVAAIGIVINAATALLFMSGRKGDLNIRAAFTHMATDALVAFGVVVAGAVILWTGWLWFDPAVSLAISLVIVASTWGLLRASVNLALAAVPESIDRVAVETFLASLPGVREIHDLHIWGISTHETALTVHLVRPDARPDDALLFHTSTELHRRFGIAHATFQVEAGDETHPCGLADASTV